MASRVYTDSRSLVRAIRSRGVELCCFDFGGTLLDFEPIHCEAFLRALGDSVPADSSSMVRTIVKAGLIAGQDSMSMASSLVSQLKLAVDPGTVAIRKRELVENFIADARLTMDAAGMLTDVSEICRVFVVTRGMKFSAAEVLNRSLPSIVSSDIRVFGRVNAQERVSKTSLIRQALSDFCVSGCKGYVGDDERDAEIARMLRLCFFAFRPYGGHC